MKRFLLILALLLIAAECRAIWIATTLQDRVENADLIVVGTLTDVERLRFSVTYRDYWMSPVETEASGEKDYIFHYNAGHIKVERMLKGSWTKDSIPFAYFGMAETETDGVRQAFRIAEFYDLQFTEGENGVWILQENGTFVPYFGVNYPGNRLPIDSLAVIERLIKNIKE